MLTLRLQICGLTTTSWILIPGPKPGLSVAAADGPAAQGACAPEPGRGAVVTVTTGMAL
jgi:hypothetical protein